MNEEAQQIVMDVVGNYGVECVLEIFSRVIRIEAEMKAEEENYPRMGTLLHYAQSIENLLGMTG